jgi:transposase-like protein
MRDTQSREVAAADADVTAPSRCPSCRSNDVRTTSKVVTAASYWRCEACGEVWNVARRRDVVHPAHNRTWR